MCSPSASSSLSFRKKIEQKNLPINYLGVIEFSLNTDTHINNVQEKSFWFQPISFMPESSHIQYDNEESIKSHAPFLSSDNHVTTNLSSKAFSVPIINPNIYEHENSVYYKVSSEINEGNFKRVIILGSPGSGKSTFAQKIAPHISLPVYGMDDLNWQPYWAPTEPELFYAKLVKLLHNKEWLIEGSYPQYLDIRLARAQFVIYLDTSTSICLWRAFKRSFFRLLGYNDDLPERIKETNSHNFNLKREYDLFKGIFSFSKNVKPIILKKLNEKKNSLTIIIVGNNCISSL